MRGSALSATDKKRHTIALCDESGNFVGCMFRFRTRHGTFLATAHHVYDLMGPKPTAVHNGRYIPLVGLKVAGYSRDLDYVLFDDSHQLHLFGAKIGKSRTYQAHSRVHSHGTCDGKNWSTAIGTSEPADAPRYYHTASTGQGFSGSPLFNDDGFIVGMHQGSELVNGKPQNVAIDLHFMIDTLERLAGPTRLESVQEVRDNAAFQRVEESDEDFEARAHEKRTKAYHRNQRFAFNS